MKNHAEIVIDAAPLAVWTAFHDVALRPRWQSAVKRLEIVAGTPGETGFSAKRFGADGDGIGIESLTESRRGDFAALLIESDQESVLEVHRFEDMGNARTRWSAWARTRFHGLRRVTALFGASALRESLANDMQRLKLLVESQQAQDE